MTVARTVADVLTEHVLFEIECIDRMYLQRLCAAAAVRGGAGRLPATAAGVADRLDRAAGARSPTRSAPAVHRFAKRQRRAAGSTSPRANARTTSCTSTWHGFTAEEGVLFIGRAQEKTAVFRTEKRRDAAR